MYFIYVHNFPDTWSGWQFHRSLWPRYKVKHLGADSIIWPLGMRSGGGYSYRMLCMVVHVMHPRGWLGLCLLYHEPIGLCLPSGDTGHPFLTCSKALYELWHCLLTFSQSGWHHYFLISLRLLYFTSYIISKRSFRIRRMSKDFLNYHKRQNNHHDSTKEYIYPVENKYKKKM